MAKIHTIQESFSTPIDPAKWTANYISSVNGRGAFSITAVGQQGELITPANHDITSSSISAKLTPTTLPPGAQAVVAMLEMGVQGPYNSAIFSNESLRVQIYGTPNGETIALSHNNWNYSGTSEYVNIAYNRTQHAYVRIRVSGSLAYLDTSPDGRVWTQRGSCNHRLTTPASVKPRFFYIHGEQQPAYIDDINIIPSSGAFMQFFQ